MTSVTRLWTGETVAILATGPSLTPEVCAAVHGKARVIAINDAHRLAPWADVLYSSDRHWYPHHKGVPSFTGMKFGIGSTVGKSNRFSDYPGITVLKNTGYTGLELDPKGLRNGRNSGFAAINLAVHFGASRIVLVGYDMGIRGGQVHFFGNHQGMSNPTDAHFGTFRRVFSTMVEPLNALSIEVINCTPGSSLDVFPMAELRDVLTPMEVAC